MVMKAKKSEIRDRPSGSGVEDETGAEAEELEEVECSEDLQELDPRELLSLLRETNRQAETWQDQFLRCRAELDNTLKRAAREKEALSGRASERLILKLLPVLDSLDQAAKQVEGMERVRRQLLDVLGAEGLAPIEAKGEKFDPYRHEALMMVESDECEEGTVTEEVLRGYTLNSRVIRFSKVLVSKKR